MLAELFFSSVLSASKCGKGMSWILSETSGVSDFVGECGGVLISFWALTSVGDRGGGCGAGRFSLLSSPGCKGGGGGAFPLSREVFLWTSSFLSSCKRKLPFL